MDDLKVPIFCTNTRQKFICSPLWKKYLTITDMFHPQNTDLCRIPMVSSRAIAAGRGSLTQHSLCPVFIFIQFRSLAWLHTSHYCWGYTGHSCFLQILPLYLEPFWLNGPSILVLGQLWKYVLWHFLVCSLPNVKHYTLNTFPPWHLDCSCKYARPAF